MFEIFNLMARLGHYNYFDYIPTKTRGKGHNKQAHKNNYKQKIKGKRGRKNG